jgi:hypothetical protein
MLRSTTFLPLTLLLGSPLVAQRAEALFEHQKRPAAIRYGEVIVGKRTIADLPIGQSWHLNTGESSTLHAETPLLAGDVVIAPGDYRLSLTRTGEVACALAAVGSGRAVGGNDWQITGDVGKLAKPTKRLAFEWRKKGALELGNQPAEVVLHFGEHEWVGAVTVLGSKEFKLTGWKGVAFLLPTARVEAGSAPVATLTKGANNWNVVLDKNSVKLVPWMLPPADRRAEVKGPDEASTVSGTVEPLEMKVEKAKEVFEVTAAKAEKGEIVIDAVFGQQGVRLRLPEPKAKPAK